MYEQLVCLALLATSIAPLIQREAIVEASLNGDSKYLNFRGEVTLIVVCAHKNYILSLYIRSKLPAPQ